MWVRLNTFTTVRWGRKHLVVVAWTLTPFFISTLADILGKWAGIPTGRPDELVNLLLVPRSGNDWIIAMIWRLSFLILVGLAASIAIRYVELNWGRRFIPPLVLFLGVVLYSYWSLVELGVVLIFIVLSFLTFYVLKQMRRLQPEFHDK